MLVSQATSEGHICVGIDEVAKSLPGAGSLTIHAPAFDAATLRSLLMESRVVGSSHAPGVMPLILDDDDRLYLHRYFDYECRLARLLAERGVAGAAAGTENSPAPNVLALLDRLFTANAANADAPDWQKAAVITALLGRLTIVSGGPGTGKTTAVVNLLACLLEGNPECRIALTAPTGKAAARITETLRQRSGHLPESLRARLPKESFTIHRLLGGLQTDVLRYTAAAALPIDVLIVDEASMLDLALAVRLFEAVPHGARIILLGDKDQLSAVESGAVFSELSANPIFSRQRIGVLSRLCGVTVPTVQCPDPNRDGALTDCVVWLQRNYRFASDSNIGLLAGEINSGDGARVLARLARPSDDSLAWRSDGSDTVFSASLRAILAGYARFGEAVRALASPTVVSTAFSQFRVLCAVREGPRGVIAINQAIATHLRRAVQHPLAPGLRFEWYPGRPVMVLRNDYVLELFNGDIGIVLPDAAGTLHVYFPDETGGFRAIAPARLPEHETAFAMTVHKSQGSEFDEVFVVLPAEQNRVLTRELLYTAVTRARARLTIMGSANVVGRTVDTATHRVSGLFARSRGRQS